MTLCTDQTLVKHDGAEGIAVPLRCKRWSCPECQPIRKRQLQQQAAAGKPNTFITLTANPDEWGDPAGRAKKLSYAWARICRQASKKWGNGKIPYIAIFEKTKRGEPHLHILARLNWIDQGWLSNKLKYYTGAHICDIRRVKSAKQAAFYVSKYVGKEPGSFGTSKRYFKTRDYLVRDPNEIASDETPATKWRVEHVDYITFLSYLEARGLITQLKAREVRFMVPEHKPRPPP